MEKIVLSLMLFIHNLFLVAFAAAPFYMLIMTRERVRLGRDIIYDLDKYIETIQNKQPARCSWFIFGAMVSGFAMPVIYFAFNSKFPPITNFGIWMIILKTSLSLAAMANSLYLCQIHRPKLEEIFARFSPGEKPDSELLNKFWVLRKRRKQGCMANLYLALALLFAAPLLRYFAL